MLLDLGRGQQGAGDGRAAVQRVAPQNGGVVPSRNLQESEDAVIIENYDLLANLPVLPI